MEDTPLVEESLEPQVHGGSLRRSKKTELSQEYQSSFQSQSLSKEAEESLSFEDNLILKTIAKLIGTDGMRLEEACIIANVKMSVLEEKMKEFPIIKKIIEVKKMEYKHMLISRLSVRARSGDDKVALSILEARYPEEFGKKKTPGLGEGDDFLTEAISFIQENGDSIPVVRKQQSIVNVRRVPAVKSDEISRLKEFLS